MGDAHPVHLSLGEIIRGDRIWSSSYDLRFGVDAPCSRLCDLRVRGTGIKRADELIRSGYVVQWLLDGLPGATTFESTNRNRKYYAAGFPLGFIKDNVSYIYNHFMLVIRYHRETNGKYTIVGFEVYPKSVSNEKCPGSSKNYQNYALKYNIDSKGNMIEQKTLIPYTYAVYWREDNSIDHDSRWDLYYENESSGAHVHIHWISFINSIILIFLGSLIVMVVLVKVLKKDIPSGGKSNSGSPLPMHGFDTEGTDWNKSLFDNIHRVPPASLLLTVLVSGGIQILIASVGVVLIFVFDSFGGVARNSLFSNHRGQFFPLLIFCFMGSSLVSSYSGIILYKLFKGDSLNQPYPQWKTSKLSLVFSGTVPMFILVVILLLNCLVWAKESSTALPFGTVMVLLSLFTLIQCPLAIIGGRYGNNRKFKTTSKNSLSPPLDKPKKIYIQPTNLSWIPAYILRTSVYGLIPFGIVFVELSFIFQSVWLEKTTFYYMYGFLLVTIIMLMIIIIESTIIAHYISLVVYQDSNWTWLSFQVGSSIGWYIYAYSIYYYLTVLNVGDFVSGLLYFGYMTCACLIIGITCGSVGVLTGLTFVKRVYGDIKVD
ncbi:Transmembrane 9 superfamily member 3 [Spathaspora sp. JA1]|nr:Transmembrane 9 superfamily member 3 [Spathaspora sp. JA1]